MAAPTSSNVHVCPEEVESLLKKYPELKYDSDKNMVICSLTGHHMHCDSAIILSYVSGKKFKKLQEEHSFPYKEYEPHIMPSNKKGRRHMLLCNLTGKHISKTVKNVMVHVNGHKYQRALQRWKECQKNGEKFQLLSKKKKKEEDDSMGDEQSFFNLEDEDEALESDADSMTDLYPPEDFLTESEDDIEMTSESTESVALSSKKSKTETGEKRKSSNLQTKSEKSVGHSKKKKKKKH